MKSTITIAAAVLLVLAAGNALGTEPAGRLSAQPIEPDIAARLKETLERAQQSDMKLSMEISRRIDYYFYMLDKIDALGKMYRETLIPMIYQRDLFSGNEAKKTPSLLRTPLVTAIEGFFVQMLQPFYALAILATGVYLLFVSGSPSGRANAKSTVIKLVIGLGLITLTIPVMETLLETSHYVSSTIISTPSIEQIGGRVSTDMFMDVSAFYTRYFLALTFFDTNMGMPFLGMLVFLPAAVLIALSIRYFMVILLTLFFPFTVLLYSFMATKRIGRILIDQTIMWVFLPVVDAVIVVASWTAYESVPYVTGLPPEVSADVKTLTAFAGFLLLAAAPFIAAATVSWMGLRGMRACSLDDAGTGGVRETKEDLDDASYEEIKEEVGA